MPLDLQILLIVVGVVIGAVSLVRHWLFKQAAQNWPLVNATVETCYIIKTGASINNWWIPVLGYSYEVDGQRYSGNIGLEGSSSFDKEAAEETGNAWQSRRIVVRFNPQKPGKSAFLPQDGAPRGAVSYADQPPDSAGVITLSLK